MLAALVAACASGLHGPPWLPGRPAFPSPCRGGDVQQVPLPCHDVCYCNEISMQLKADAHVQRPERVGSTACSSQITLYTQIWRVKASRQGAS